MPNRDLTRGNVLRNIISFALPYMLTMFLQILYGMADMLIIGQYYGVNTISAVSNGAQVMSMITMILMGFTVGTTVLVARAVGTHDLRSSKKIVGNSISFFLVVSIVLGVVLLFVRSNIVHWLNVPREVSDETLSYLAICFAGIPFLVGYDVIASLYRGLGDSRRPLYFIAIACATNVVLDLFFIGYLRLGAAGAALGTIASQLVSVLAAWIAIRRHTLFTQLRWADFKWKLSVLKNILGIGLPISLQEGFIQLSFIAIMIIANQRSIIDSAAVGIVEKFIGLLFIIPSAMLASVSTIAAQNFGASQHLRARITLWYSIFISSSISLLVALVVQFFPNQITDLFTDDARVIAAGSEYLRGFVWDCVFAGIHFCFSGFFTAMGLAILSFGHNFLSIVLIRVPISYFASIWFPTTLYPMGLAPTFGSIFSALVCVAAYIYLKRSKKYSWTLRNKRQLATPHEVKTMH